MQGVSRVACTEALFDTASIQALLARTGATAQLASAILIAPSAASLTPAAIVNAIVGAVATSAARALSPPIVVNLISLNLREVTRRHDNDEH